MKKYLISTLFLLICFYGNSQSKAQLNSIGISIPIIRNSSKAVYYNLGTRKEPDGKATSYGLNAIYSRTIYKNIFGSFGIGYFNQNFKIARPFNFDDLTNLLFRTESYSYRSINLLFYVGYNIELTKKIFLKNSIGFNSLHSFKQNYKPSFLSNSSTQSSQTNTKSIRLGNNLKIDCELNYKITKFLNLGFGITIPFVVKWNNDEIFFKYNDITDSQIIAYNKFSVGSLLSLSYNLK